MRASPPCARATACTRDSPSPEPGVDRLCSARLNRSKAWAAKSSGNPGPASRTTTSSVPSATSAHTVTGAAPCRRAFPTRLETASSTQRRLTRTSTSGACTRTSTPSAAAPRTASRSRSATGTGSRGIGPAPRSSSMSSSALARSTSRCTWSCIEAEHRRRLRVAAGPVPVPLELGPHQRQRRAQLVRGVREELPLPLGAGLEPVQQVVEGVAEPGQLVVASGGHRQPALAPLLDPLDGAPVALDRVQRRAGGAVADEGGGDQRDQVRDGELEQQLAQRLVVLAPADRGRHEAGARRRVHPERVDPERVRRGGQEAAEVEADLGAPLERGEPVGVEERRHGPVPADLVPLCVVGLEGLAGGVRGRRLSRVHGPFDDLLVGVEVLVDLPVEGVGDPPVDEAGGQHQHHRHRDRHPDDQPGDDGAPADQPLPDPHRPVIGTRSRAGTRPRAAS